MRIVTKGLLRAVSLFALLVGPAGVELSHGDEQPQLLDTAGLKKLGEKWLVRNPYRGDKLAIEIGSDGYITHCAHCHGLEGRTGGFAPDLRYLEADQEGDEWYVERVRKGFVHNGVTKMPPFEGLLSQEALWAIRSYINSLPKD